MAKQTLKEKLAKRKKQLKEKSGGGGNVQFIKADTTMRVRVLPVGEDEEFAIEVTQFYLGGTIKGVYSNATFGEACPIMEKYEKLKKSKKEADKELAKLMVPKGKWLMPIVQFEDERGKKISDRSPTLVQVTGGLYQEVIDLYLDEDEWGDMTDPKNGYDLKFSRVGSTMTDTEYSVKPCKNTPTPKAFAKKIYNLEEMVGKVIPSYEEAKEKLDEFLHGATDDVPSKKKKKKKKKKSDI